MLVFKKIDYTIQVTMFFVILQFIIFETFELIKVFLAFRFFIALLIFQFTSAILWEMIFKLNKNTFRKFFLIFGIFILFIYFSDFFDSLLLLRILFFTSILFSAFYILITKKELSEVKLLNQ